MGSEEHGGQQNRPMKLTANVKRRFDMEHRILDKLAKFLPVGEPVEGMSYPDVAERIGEPVHAVLQAKHSLESAGVLSTWITYPKGKPGRVGTWQLQLPPDLAHEELTKEHELQLTRPSRKVERLDSRRPLEITRLILGEESSENAFEQLRSLRKNEPMALVEAARQYMHRHELVQSRVQELRDAGVEVAMDALEIPRDPILEAVSLVVPAIDKIMGENSRLVEQNTRWSSRLGDCQEEREELRRNYDGAKRALDERIARDVAKKPAPSA